MGDAFQAGGLQNWRTEELAAFNIVNTNRSQIARLHETVDVDGIVAHDSVRL